MSKRNLTQILDGFQPDAEFEAARDAANVELVAIIAQYLTDNRSLRFGQALRNLDIIREISNPTGAPGWVNEFNTEPQEMVRRARLALDRMS